MLPCMQFPSTVIFLDDDKYFLDVIDLRNSNKFVTKLFSCPYEAHEKLMIKNKLKVDIFEKSDDIASENIGAKLNESESLIKIKWSSLINVAKNEERFRIPTVIVVDYNMPNINGIEFLKKIKDMSIKKIMLTGEADQYVGINAFNDGLINRFIMKNTKNLYETICDNIYNLQQDYFCEFSPFTFGLRNEIMSLLNSNVAANFYKSIKNNLGAVEHYMLDKNGSMLFVNEDGTYHTLVVQTKEEAVSNAEYLRDCGHSDLADEVEGLKKIVYLPENNATLEFLLENNIHKAYQFLSTDDQCFALISNPQSQLTCLNQIKSFKAFRQN